MSKPRCPSCGKPPKLTHSDGTHVCPLGHLFDDDVLEGGDYSDRDPSRRLVRAEEQREAHKANDQRRQSASRGFRFSRR